MGDEPVDTQSLDATVKPQVTAAAPSEDALPRADKHRYTLARELGRGAQSVVCLALDAAVGREVAFKMVHDASGDRAFVREARITGQLEHPGIVPVYEIGRDERGQHYCTQKLVRGRSLRAALEACRTAAERLELLPHLVDVCNAVAYAHSRGVVHRDLKPENVMVGEFGETVVLDWGIAKVLGGSDEAVERPLAALAPNQTQHGAVMGTPLYLSPEQASGDPSAIDRRSDVWSLGVMLYELVAGRRPFEARNVEALLARVRSGAFEPLLEAAPGVSRELAAIVTRALQRAPSDRFADAAALAKELAAFRAGGRLSVYQYSSWELVRRFVARNRALTAVAAAAFVAVTGASAVALRNGQRAEANLKEARHRLAGEFITRAREAERELDWNEALSLYRRSLEVEDSRLARWGVGLLSAYETHPQRVATLDTASVWEACFDAAGQRVLATSRTAVTSFDRNGARVASWERRNGAVLAASGDVALLPGTPAELVATAGGPPRTLEGTPEARTAAFRPGSGAVAIARSSGAVELYDVASGARLTALAAPRPCEVLAFSPEGRLLACAGTGGDVAVWDVESGQRTHLLKAQLYPSVLLFDGTHRLLVGDQDRLILVFTLDEDEPLKTLVGHRRGVLRLVWSADRRHLASSSADGTVVVWARESLRPLVRLSGAPPAGVQFSADGQSLDVVTMASERLRWSLASLPRIVAATPRGGIVTSATFSADGGAVAWCSVGGAGLTSVESGLTLRGDAGCLSVAAAPDGHDLAIALRGAGIAILDATTLATRAVIDAGPQVRRLAWSREGDALWYTSAGALHRWSRSSNTVERTFDPDAGSPAVLAFSSDGQRVAWAEERRLIVAAGTGRQAVDVGDAVTSVSFSTDDALLAVGTTGGGVVLLDGNTGAVRCRAEGHTSVSRAFSFSPDGRVLASASFDLSVRLWDTRTCEPLGRLPGLHHEGFQVLWSPSGTQLAVADTLGTMLIFDVNAPDEPRSSNP